MQNPHSKLWIKINEYKTVDFDLISYEYKFFLINSALNILVL